MNSPNSVMGHGQKIKIPWIFRGLHSLQHLFCSVTAQIIGHRIDAIEGCFHIQAADEVFWVVLVEVECQFSHICPFPQPEIIGLISGGTVLWEKEETRELDEMGLERFVEVTPTSCWTRLEWIPAAMTNGGGKNYTRSMRGQESTCLRAGGENTAYS